MQNIEFEKREQTRLAFVKKYVPEGVESGHTLLYDWDSSSGYLPAVDELGSCLSSYLVLLRDVPEDEPWDVLGVGMLDASELLLAFLTRADGAVVNHELSAALQHEIESLLEKLVKFREEYAHYDGSNRLRSISELLNRAISDQPAAGS